MKKYIAGIDIGGSKITGVLFDGSRTVDSLTIVTPKDITNFKKNLIKLLDFLSAHGKISAIGVSVAGLIDNKKGVVVDSPNIQYLNNFALAKFISGSRYKSVMLDNDASCFLRAETLVGGAKKYKNVFGAIVGTGIGGALMIDGKLYRGSNNFGAEWGRWQLLEGKFEQLYHESFHGRNTRKLQIVFGQALTNLVDFIQPECIVLGGGYVGEHHAEFLPQALDFAKKHRFSKKTFPKVYISKLKNAGALGAALMITAK